MKILLLVPVHKKEKTAPVLWQTGLPYFQAHNFWYKALTDLGHDVKLFIYSGGWERAENAFAKFNLEHNPLSSILQTALPSIRRKQKQILALAQQFKPQLVILSGNTNSIFPQTLFKIKKLYKSKLVLLNGVAPVVFATSTERKMAPFFDYIFTNDLYHTFDWQMLGAKNAQMLPISAIDPDVHKKYKLTETEKKNLGSDVSFVGRFNPSLFYQNRIDYLENLTDFNLKIWTDDKDLILSHPRLKKFFAGSANGEKMLKIFSASKINLNIHANFMLYGGNLRTFEIPSAGGFELVDKVDKNWFLGGKEIFINFVNQLKTSS